MPIRATLALVATVVALVMVFSYKTPEVAVNRPLIVHSTTVPPSGPGAGAPGTSGASAWRDGSFTGQDVQNQYGDVVVVVTISGGKITDVQPTTLPQDRARSAEISQAAAPLLHDEILQAQSAQIDIISGATYTSQSYAQSVQSALDQARA